LEHFGQNRQLAIEDRFRRAGADLLRISTQEDYVPVLRDYFLKRHRRGGRR
jgi:hypothetical protein